MPVEQQVKVEQKDNIKEKLAEDNKDLTTIKDLFENATNDQSIKKVLAMPKDDPTREQLALDPKLSLNKDILNAFDRIRDKVILATVAKPTAEAEAKRESDVISDPEYSLTNMDTAIAQLEKIQKELAKEGKLIDPESIKITWIESKEAPIKSKTIPLRGLAYNKLDPNYLTKEANKNPGYNTFKAGKDSNYIALKEGDFVGQASSAPTNLNDKEFQDYYKANESAIYSSSKSSERPNDDSYNNNNALAFTRGKAAEDAFGKDLGLDKVSFSGHVNEIINPAGGYEQYQGVDMQLKYQEKVPVITYKIMNPKAELEKNVYTPGLDKETVLKDGIIGLSGGLNDFVAGKDSIATYKTGFGVHIPIYSFDLDSEKVITALDKTNNDPAFPESAGAYFDKLQTNMQAIKDRDPNQSSDPLQKAHQLKVKELIANGWEPNKTNADTKFSEEEIPKLKPEIRERFENSTYNQYPSGKRQGFLIRDIEQKKNASQEKKDMEVSVSNLSALSNEKIHAIKTDIDDWKSWKSQMQ